MYSEPQIEIPGTRQYDMKNTDSEVGWGRVQIPDLLFVNWVILTTFLDLPRPQFAYLLNGAAHRTCLRWILHEKRCDVCVYARARIYLPRTRRHCAEGEGALVAEDSSDGEAEQGLPSPVRVFLLALPLGKPGH